MKRVLIAVLFAVFCLSANVWAAPFPPKTDEVVQDEGGYLDKEQKEDFTEFVRQYPDSYKVVVVEGVKPEANSVDEYAQKLYDNYNLSDNTMMIVLDINSQELGVFPGPALKEKGADLTMLHDKIVTYYMPFSNQKEYMKGIKTFVAEVNNELGRIAAKQEAAPGAQTNSDAAPEVDRAKPESLWNLFPWWVYALAVLFLLFVIGLLYAFIRRNSILAEVDRVEDWKDELVQKIQLVELDKPLRRATGATEEWYAQLANRKEHLLRMRIPDVEMIILEAEEACDRLRFGMALDLLAEAEDLLTELEGELAQLKADSTQVAEKKKENTLTIPEIGKLAEQCEWKLTNARLDYGLTFHEWKAKLDEVEGMRETVKELLAAGDTVQAHDLAVKAQEILRDVLASLERLPELVKRVQKEMVDELKQLEADIALVLKDGYELSQSQLEASLLQVKQLLISAETALEEGNLKHVEMHVKAFSIKLDETYQYLEEAVLSQRQAAAALAAEPAVSVPQPQIKEDTEALQHQTSALDGQQSGAEQPLLDPADLEQASAQEDSPRHAEPAIPAVSGAESEAAVSFDRPEKEHSPAAEPISGGSVTTEDERRLLLAREESLSNGEETQDSLSASFSRPFTGDDVPVSEEDEVEYELVVPKRLETPQEPTLDDEETSPAPRIETEDDALDVMEYISNSLLRIRQQIKRSYLPGVPDEVKFRFDQVVQKLAQIKMSMERYGYELQEVAEMLMEAQEELRITEQLAQEAIATCQKAEGAIQYTNRYRRQNRQVHELLTKAEQAFRQLRFAEALSLAEEARMLVERESGEDPAGSGWLLRPRKKRAEG
ncbi:MAG: negative regulator of septation ring formation [Brevibacillus sp.]|nr:negative regulator of septation ring formation [Brevibacillus sp.]